MTLARIWLSVFGIASLAIAVGTWVSNLRQVDPQPSHASAHPFSRADGISPTSTVKGTDTTKTGTRAHLTQTTVDPFHAVQFHPSTPAPAYVPAAAPAERQLAPQFPYQFAGRMVDVDGNTLTFFIRDGNLTQVRPADVLDGVYRVDSVNDAHIQITFLPLNEQLTLTLTTVPH